MPSAEPDVDPAPSPWPARRWGPRHVLAAVFASACTALGLVAVATLVAAGEFAGLRYAVPVTLLFALVLVHGVLVWFRPRRSVRDVVLVQREGRPGTALRPSAALFATLCALMVDVTVLAGVVTADYLLAGDEVTARWGAVALAGAATAFLASFPVAVLRGRVRRGELVLDAEGVHQRGRSFTSSLRWDDVLAARAHPDPRWPRVAVLGRPDGEWRRSTTARVWRLDRLPRVPAVDVDCLTYALDPNVVHDLVTFYVDDPAARSELGGPASLRRAAALAARPRP